MNDHLVTPELLEEARYLIDLYDWRHKGTRFKDDMISAVYFGVAKAANSFDPSKGVPFEKYALWMARNHLSEFWREFDLLSRAERAKMREIQKKIKRDEVLTVEEQKTFDECPRFIYLDDKPSGFLDSQLSEERHSDYLEDFKERLPYALERLTPFQKDVIWKVDALDTPQDELARETNTSKTNISVTRERALENLRRLCFSDDALNKCEVTQHNTDILAWATGENGIKMPKSWLLRKKSTPTKIPKPVSGKPSARQLRQKKRAAERKALGICFHCPKPVFTTTLCEEHARIQRERVKKCRRQKKDPSRQARHMLTKKAKGLCDYCMEPKVNASKCEYHAAIHRERERKRHQAKKLLCLAEKGKLITLDFTTEEDNEKSVCYA